jgi:hypothetical protein
VDTILNSGSDLPGLEIATIAKNEINEIQHAAVENAKILA